jgi:2-polyprenyl-6-methoxyphenol hydroxylase-like FAD-dependent oxidoreductase
MPESAARTFHRLGTTEVPTDTRRLFGTAVVLGGSIAGLLAARVLADHAERVVVVERDEITGAPAPRPGVPQSTQVHTLLPGGRRQLDRWFDGFSREAVAAGAVQSGPDDLRVHYNGRLKVSTPDVDFLSSSRPFLEALVRRRTTSLPNVVAVRGRALGVELADGRVTGVRHETPEGETVRLDADFVVDAMGRSSRLGHWLAAAGWQQPGTRRMNIDVNYTTARFQRKESRPEVTTALAFWALDRLPADVAPAACSAIEDDQWMIMFGGFGDDAPGRTPEEFRRICRALPGTFADAVEGEMIGEIQPYKQADSRRRDYHLLDRFPARLVSVGDAVASFNPIYGQGMSSAALHASCLSEHLRSSPDLDAPARRFFALQRVVVDAAWQTSATPDLALPHVGGPYPRGYHLAKRLTDHVVDATVTDVEVSRRFNAVTEMRAHPSTLVTPGVVLRTLRATLRDRRDAVPS